jgi:hypothetical protein
MSKLKPWAAGPFELIRHADGHLKAGSDFDKRMALISYDNAIEVPKLRARGALQPRLLAGKLRVAVDPTHYKNPDEKYRITK